jgi:hypothetical protein
MGMSKPRPCRAFQISEAGKEYCQGKSGHKWHWRKLYDVSCSIIKWRNRRAK